MNAFTREQLAEYDDFQESLERYFERKRQEREADEAFLASHRRWLEKRHAAGERV